VADIKYSKADQAILERLEALEQENTQLRSTVNDLSGALEAVEGLALLTSNHEARIEKSADWAKSINSQLKALFARSGSQAPVQANTPAPVVAVPPPASTSTEGVIQLNQPRPANYCAACDRAGIPRGDQQCQTWDKVREHRGLEAQARRQAQQA
jgi:hypothetical protein